VSRWFRFYADAMRNPKVLRLSDKDFRLWVRLLAVASENEGRIMALPDLKLTLAMRLDHLKEGINRLISGGLIDALEHGYEPHNWSKFQYKSDTSNERVAKHRAARNVTVTPPETETETEEEKTVANATDGEPSQDANSADEPIDLKALLFSTGKPYLIRNGVTAANAGSILGKWRQTYGDGAVIDALALAQSEACSDPIPFITKILERRHANNGTGRPMAGNARTVVEHPARAMFKPRPVIIDAAIGADGGAA